MAYHWKWVPSKIRPSPARRLTGFLHESKLYGRVRSGRRTVPSAGAFYSLVIHVLAPRQVGQLPAGIWLFDGETGELGLVSEEPVTAADAFVPTTPTTPFCTRATR